MIDDTYGTRRQVTAYFDTRGDAEAAVRRLQAEGLASADVQMIEGSDGSSGQEDDRGFMEKLADMFLPDDDQGTYAEGLRRGGYIVSARVDDENYMRAVDILDVDGSVDLDERSESWRSEGWTGYGAGVGSSDAAMGETGLDPASSGSGMTGAAAGSGVAGTGTTGTGATRGSEDDETIDVVEEQLKVGKRDVSHGRVRVRSYVVEQPVSQDVSLRSERVDIERRPVDRPVNATDDAFRDRTIEMEEREEEAVMSKEARVVEEVHVGKTVDERTETVSDTLRRTEVEVDEEDDTTSRDRFSR